MPAKQRLDKRSFITEAHRSGGIAMTERLRRAVDRITAVVPEAEQLLPEGQDALAERLEVIMNELRWAQLLVDPKRATAVDALTEDALADFASGKMRSLGDVFSDESL
jgi:hypothetical protein